MRKTYYTPCCHLSLVLGDFPMVFAACLTVRAAFPMVLAACPMDSQEFMEKPSRLNCDSESDNFGYMVTKGGSCEQLTSNDPSAEVIEVSERVSLTDIGDTQDGLRISRAVRSS